MRGGLPAIEVTLRTPAARGGDRADRRRGPRAPSSAPARSRRQRRSREALAAGARFLVSPGATPALLDGLQASGVPFLPGMATRVGHRRAARARHHPREALPGRGGRRRQGAQGVRGTVPADALLPDGRDQRGEGAGLPRAAERGLRRRLVDGQRGLGGCRGARRPGRRSAAQPQVLVRRQHDEVAGRCSIARPSGSPAASVSVEPAQRVASATGCGSAVKLASDEQRSPACSRQSAKTCSLPVHSGSADALDVDRARGAAGRDQPLQPGPQPALDRRRVVPARSGLPVHRGPVHPAVVVALVRVLEVRRVVQEPELVAHVDQRQAAVGEGDRVQEQDRAARRARRHLVRRALQPRQRGARAGRARLAGPRVGLEARAARERAREVARIEVGQEAPMQVRVLADARRRPRA